jgi:nucleoside 2-deoxyribosyltransferase
MKRFVYLAGPISGCNYGEAVDWRQHVSGLFLPGIKGISPMRLKDWCKKLKAIKDVKQYAKIADEDDFLISGESHAINTRDMFDVRTCDMLYIYLPKELTDKTGLSAGTVKEIGYAARDRKPMVLVTDDKKLAGHPLLREDIGWIVPTLELGAEVVNSVLGVYVEE